MSKGSEEYEVEERPPPKVHKAFAVKLIVELDSDLAIALGEFILDSKDCRNAAIIALAHKLVGS